MYYADGGEVHLANLKFGAAGKRKRIDVGLLVDFFLVIMKCRRNIERLWLFKLRT